MSQEEKFLKCLTKATKGKKDLTNFEVLEFAFSIFCCLDNYIQNNVRGILKRTCNYP